MLGLVFAKGSDQPKGTLYAESGRLLRFQFQDKVVFLVGADGSGEA